MPLRIVREIYVQFSITCYVFTMNNDERVLVISADYGIMFIRGGGRGVIYFDRFAKNCA